MKPSTVHLALTLLCGCTGTIGPSGPSASEESGPATRDGSGPEVVAVPPIEGVDPRLRCDPDALPSNPTRLWRLNREQLAATYERAFGVSLEASSNPFESIGSGDEAAFSNMSATSHISSGVAEALHELAPSLVRPAVDAAIAESPCLGASPLAEGCLRAAFEPLVARTTRRSGNDEYVDFLVRRAMDESNEGGDGVLLAYALLATSPQTLFRFEVEETLGAEAYAEYLSFTLTDSPPPDGLAERLAGGTDVRAEARAMLESPAGRGVLLRFVREYFDYEGDGTDESRALAASTDAWVGSIVDSPNFFEELLLSTEVYANGATAEAYGVMASGEDFERFDLASQRSGILTQPSFLKAHSGMAPVHRGLFVLRHLLCDDVRGTIPPFDAPQIDDNSTLRQQLEAHRASPECSYCHARMDPLGFPLEQYDTDGVWRAMEAGQPVDTTSELLIGSDIDGEFGQPRDLMERLAASEQARTCFVNHAFRFVYGRLPRVDESFHVSGADACTIADATLRWGEGSLTELFVELVVDEAATRRTSFLEAR